MAQRLLEPHRWTVKDLYRMVESGLLREDARVELIEGEIVEMSPIGSRHNRCVNRFTMLLAPALAGRAIVQIQGPLDLDERSQPQPDVAVIAWRDDFYPDGVGVEDALLVVEVADSSIVADKKVKFPLYARSGVAEAWLVDLIRDRIEVHTEPGLGGYGQVRVLGAGDVLEGPLGVSVAVAELLR